MKLVIGCDHAGLELKIVLKKHLESQGHVIFDCGTKTKKRTNYSFFGSLVASKVVSGDYERGIVICGTGIGISNAANKTKGARVVLLNSLIGADRAITVLNANIIGFGARVTGSGLACMIVDKFLNGVYIKNDINDLMIDRINNLI